ncbi:MAG: hypothetical protein J6R47_05140 [Acholeplasmatales bacterium]|nr:hypothetical protein [Acholeplasmatales bacterium]
MEIAKKIENARDSIKELMEIYTNNCDQLEANDHITQDILHQMELGSYNEGRKWYGALRKARKDRRVNKDTIEVLTKFMELMNTDYAIKFMRQLDEALGSARNEEKRLNNRHYTAKYLHDLPISKDIS